MTSNIRLESGILEPGTLPPQHIVDDAGKMPEVVSHAIAHHHHKKAEREWNAI